MNQFLISFFLLFAVQTVRGKTKQTEAEKNVCLKEHSNSRKKFADGNGSKENPFVICNVYQLQRINNNRNAHYILGQNIDASLSHTDLNFIPIEKFSGELNGNGFVVQNLYIQGSPELLSNIKISSPYSVGLFHMVSSGARIKNLNLKDPTFYIEGAKEIAVGGLVGEIEVDKEPGVIITNSCVSGSMTLSGSNNSISGVGGLIGKINTGKQKTLPWEGKKASVQISQSCFNGSISLSDENNSISYMGELVGVVEIKGNNYELKITDSYVEADATFHAEAAENKFNEMGGLIGKIELIGNSRFEIRNCSVRGQMNFSSKNKTVSSMGGLIGRIWLFQGAKLEIADSYIETDTTFHTEKGYSYMGKLAGGISISGSGGMEVRNYSVQGQMNFSSKDSDFSGGGLNGYVFLNRKSYMKIENSQIEDEMFFLLENNRKSKLGNLVGTIKLHGGSRVEILNNDLNGAMTLHSKSHSEFAVGELADRLEFGGLIGQLEIKGSVKITDSDVNGPIILSGSHRESGENNPDTRLVGGLVGGMNYIEDYSAPRVNLGIIQSDMKIIDSDVNTSITLSGKINLNSRSVGGLIGLIIPKDRYIFGTAKGHIEIKNSYVRNGDKDSSLINLFHSVKNMSHYDQWKCSDSQWMNLHNSDNDYHIVISDKTLNDCLLVEPH